MVVIIPEPPIDVIDDNEKDLWCEQWLRLAKESSWGLVKLARVGDSPALDFWIDSDAVAFKLTENYDLVLARHAKAYLEEKSYFRIHQ
jgi:hypothetical protein